MIVARQESLDDENTNTDGVSEEELNNAIALEREYVNAQLIDLMADVEAQGIDITLNLTDYVDTTASNTLNEANTTAQGYADTAESNANEYTDTTASNTLNEANTTAQGYADTAESNANEYTDTQIEDISNQMESGFATLYQSLSQKVATADTATKIASTTAQQYASFSRQSLIDYWNEEMISGNFLIPNYVFLDTFYDSSNNIIAQRIHISAYTNREWGGGSEYDCMIYGNNSSTGLGNGHWVSSLTTDEERGVVYTPYLMYLSDSDCWIGNCYDQAHSDQRGLVIHPTANTTFPKGTQFTFSADIPSTDYITSNASVMTITRTIDTDNAYDLTFDYSDVFKVSNWGAYVLDFSTAILNYFTITTSTYDPYKFTINCSITQSRGMSYTSSTQNFEILIPFTYLTSTFPICSSSYTGNNCHLQLIDGTGLLIRPLTQLSWYDDINFSINMVCNPTGSYSINYSKSGGLLTIQRPFYISSKDISTPGYNDVVINLTQSNMGVDMTLTTNTSMSGSGIRDSLLNMPLPISYITNYYNTNHVLYQDSRFTITSWGGTDPTTSTGDCKYLLLSDYSVTSFIPSFTIKTFIAGAVLQGQSIILTPQL